MCNEWLTGKMREPLKWAGTCLFAVGSMLFSVYPEMGFVWWTFALFLIGHSMWAAAGLMMRDQAVIALNLMYLPFDIYAVAIRI